MSDLVDMDILGSKVDNIKITYADTIISSSFSCNH
jgi:hypothetical protein